MTLSSAKARVRVALVEDHAATRAAVTRDLADFDDRIELAGAFADGASFLRACAGTTATLRIDVALVDLGLPDMRGSELIEALARTAPHVRAVALTAFSDESHVLKAIRAGAYGYLVKDEPIERIARAVEEAAGGESPVSSRVAGFLISHARRAPPSVVMSDREAELSRALAEGLSYAECATRMGIALGTVQEYVKRLYKKLEVHSRSEVRTWVERNMDL